MSRIIHSDKLIRDKIPEILFNNNAAFEVSNCRSEKQYRERLADKLIEEALEIKGSLLVDSKEQTIEELADLLEVMQHSCELMEITMAEVEEARKNKLKTHGGYSKQFILSWYEENRK